MNTMIEVRIAETPEEKEAVYRFRYSVYVEEMGRYQATADHHRRTLSDPEDDHSWIFYATVGSEVVGSFRITWGGDGFSRRQIDQYQLEPFLAQIPARHLSVGERTMVSPSWRGGDIFDLMGERTAELGDRHEVHAAFGACEPHLISFYGRYQRPYGSRNINSAESGYLIPLVSFPHGPDALAGIRPDGGVPEIVEHVLSGTGTVTSPIYLGDEPYLDGALDAIDATGSAVFEELTRQQVAGCIDRSNIIEFRAGDHLVKAGGTARNLFVLLDGELDASRDGKWIGSIHPGELVGEMAFLLEQPRSSDVVASTDGRLLSLSERTVRGLMERDPATAATLHRNMARQLCARLHLAGKTSPGP